jgi:hypothetical protein
MAPITRRSKPVAGAGVSGSSPLLGSLQDQPDSQEATIFVSMSQLCGLAAVVAAVGAIKGSTQRYVTDWLLIMKFLQIPNFSFAYALSTAGVIGIVAPKVAGSSLVGHPPVFRIGKPHSSS